MLRFMVLLAASFLPAAGVHAEPSHAGPRPGDTYEVMLERLSSERTGDESSGSSTDRDVILERVIAVRDDGLELEYDLRAEATFDERASIWQFPVRIFRPNDGPSQLLNRPELEARVDDWLKRAQLTRAECGSWYFTWNVFRIECDPQSVIETIAAFDPSFGDLRDGALYRDRMALGSTLLARKRGGQDGATYTAEMKIDPDAVRRDRAESDVMVANIRQKALTLDEALRTRAADVISGTISVAFDTDSTGHAWRRRKVTKTEIRTADGPVEARTVTETVERRLVQGSPSPSRRPRP
jgi:hypothetical protein